jgi:hypothetical protein
MKRDIAHGADGIGVNRGAFRIVATIKDTDRACADHLHPLIGPYHKRCAGLHPTAEQFGLLRDNRKQTPQAMLLTIVVIDHQTFKKANPFEY